MSRQMNLPQIQRILQEFERESSMMDMKEEMMGESIDDAMEDDVGETEEEEGDRILDEVLAEIGVSVGQQVRSVLCSFLSPTFKVYGTDAQVYDAHHSSEKRRPRCRRAKSRNRASAAPSRSASRPAQAAAAAGRQLIPVLRAVEEETRRRVGLTTCRRGWTTCEEIERSSIDCCGAL